MLSVQVYSGDVSGNAGLYRRAVASHAFQYQPYTARAADGRSPALAPSYGKSHAYYLLKLLGY